MTARKSPLILPRHLRNGGPAILRVTRKSEPTWRQPEPLVPWAVPFSPTMLAVTNRSTPTGNGSTASATSIATGYGTTTGAGSLLVALVWGSLGTPLSVLSVSDPANGNWTKAVGLQAYWDNEIWYFPNAASVTNLQFVTATFSASNGYRALVLYEVTGMGATPAVDTTATGNNATTGTAISSGALNQTGSGGNVNFACIIGAGAPVSAGGSFTGTNFSIVGDPNAYFLDEYHIFSGNESATATQTTSNGWLIVAASFTTTPGVPGSGFHARPYYDLGSNLNV